MLKLNVRYFAWPILPSLADFFNILGNKTRFFSQKSSNVDIFVKRPQPQTLRGSSKNVNFSGFDYALKNLKNNRWIENPLLLAHVPTECFNNWTRFPDEDTFNNWLASIDICLEQGRLNIACLPYALFGLAKINVTTSGQIVPQIGWPKLAGWFNLVIDECIVGNEEIPIVRNKCYKLNVQSLYRFVKHSEIPLAEYQPISDRFLKFLPAYFDTIGPHDDHKRSFTSTLWYLQLSLHLEILDEDFRTKLIPFLVDLFESSKFYTASGFLVNRMRIAEILLYWNYSDKKFWQLWLQTCKEQYDPIENFSVQFLAHVLKKFLICMVRFNLGEEFQIYKKFWHSKMALYLNFLRPFDIEDLKNEIESESCLIFSEEDKKDILDLLNSHK